VDYLHTKKLGLNTMTTHFITAEVDLQKTPIKLKEEIEKQLQKEGEILRWAVTNVDSDQQKAQVEAIVTR
jgi:ribosomal protein S6